MRRLEYHGAGAGKAPKNGQDALDQSLQITAKSSSRVGVDYKAGQFVIFDEHSPGRYQGQVREWKKLGPDAQKTLIEWGMASERGRILIGGIYEHNPKHPRWTAGGPTGTRASKAPKNGQKALEESVQIKPTSPRRIGVDDDVKEFVIFDEHVPGKFHGHVRTWADLEPAAKRALIDSGRTTKSGRIL